MHSKKIALALLAGLAGTTTAAASPFFWNNNGPGSWSDHTMWNGPAGQVPDSVLDSATVSGGNVEAMLTSATALGGLTILNGAEVYSGGHSLFVNGDIDLWGLDSSLSTSNSPSLRDLDVDEFSIKQAWYAIYESLTEIDESMTVEENGVIIGSGTIDMNSTTGNLDVDHGTLWAMGDQNGEFAITRTDSSTSRLDWTSADSSFVVWDAMTMRNELPYTGSLGGRISIASNGGHSTFESVHPFVAGQTSQLEFNATNGWISRLEAPGIDSYGQVNLYGPGLIDSALLAVRGNVNFYDDATLLVRSTTTIFDSAGLYTYNADGGVTFSTGAENLNVTGGYTAVWLGAEGHFDLAGSQGFTTNIDETCTLHINAEYLNTGLRHSTQGSVEIEGTLLIEEDVGATGDEWENMGLITIDNGDYLGRNILNNGVIHGRGRFDTNVQTEGEVIAEGGTLDFRELNPGGVIRAETGDITTGVPSQFSFTTYFFTGDMFIGDGQGVREVYDSVDGMFFHDSFLDETGSLTMNEGRLVLANTRLAGDISIQGHSTITATRESSGAYIKFVREGTTVNVDGTLDLRGNVEIQAAPTFLGSGTIDAASISRTIDLAPGVDLGDLALDVAGTLTMGDNEPSLVGQASARSLQLDTLSRVRVDMGGLTPDVDHDQLNTSGGANIDGELVLRRVNGYQPVPGVTFAVINGGQVTGEFDSVDLTNISDTYRVEIEYPGDRVNVTFFCKADINGDGILNGADFNAFLQTFNADDMIADQNDDGVLNGGDFNAWLTNFNLGCG